MACVCAPLANVPGVRAAAETSEKLTSTSEGRMALHKIATYVLKFFQETLPYMFNRSCELAMKFIAASDALFVGTLMFSLMGYFGFRKAEKPHLEMKDGQVVKNLDKTPY